MQMQIKDNEILKLQMKKRDSEFVMQNNQTRSVVSMQNNTTNLITTIPVDGHMRQSNSGLARLNSQHSHLT